MTPGSTSRPGHPSGPSRARRAPGAALAAIAVMALVLLGALTCEARGASGPATIESIEVAGNTRTSADLIRAASGLRAGEPASAPAILDAAERLREGHLVRDAQVHTRPGSEPGRVVVVLSVVENRPKLRLGLGYEDLSGWYLIPLRLDLDNLTGHGESLRFSTRIGYRETGLVISLRRPSLGDERAFWEVRLRGEGQDRIYFLDETETLHRVERGGVDLRAGIPLSRRFAIEGWLGWENVDADSSAEVYRNNPVLDHEKGDEIPFEALPAEIQSGIGERKQSRIGLALGIDTRRGAGLGARGLWGRSSAEAVIGLDEEDRGDGNANREVWPVLLWDLRGYLPLSGRVQLAARTRAGAIDERAVFSERFYLGGLYTVRGYASQSLSPPGGHGRFAAASIEIRAAWIGPASDPVFSSVAFLDTGVGWNGADIDLSDGASGIGYGFRIRLPWVGRLGVDVGIPLSPSPTGDAFRVNGGIGWTF